MSGNNDGPKPADTQSKDARAARLAEQLRANLKRRKAAARGRPASGAPDDPAGDAQ